MGFLKVLNAGIRALCKDSRLSRPGKQAAVNNIFRAPSKNVSVAIAKLRHAKTPTPIKIQQALRWIWCYCATNPKKTAALIGFGVLVGMTTSVVAVAVLKALGFSSSGPVAGSFAASFQSKFGVNPIFSALQSAAMGGYAVAAVYTGLTLITAIIGAGCAAAFTGLSLTAWAFVKRLVFWR